MTTLPDEPFCPVCQLLVGECEHTSSRTVLEDGPRGTSSRRLALTRASDIAPEPVTWAWLDDGQGRIPAGSVILFAGREGTGKSSFCIWLAARITTGTLPGSFYGTPRGVIIAAVEDSSKFTLVPRLIAAGADLSRVYRAEVREDDHAGVVSLSLPADNDLLEDAIIRGNVAMVVLDPLMSAISDSLDTHVNRKVRMALDPLARMAERTGVIVAGIAHFNKSGGTDASSLITGSGAFKDVARSVFAFATGDNDLQVITEVKNNLGRNDLPSLAYRLIDTTVPTPKGDTHVVRLEMDGTTPVSVRDILTAQARGDDRQQSELDRAKEFLGKALADGPRQSRDVEGEALEVHDISKKTLKRARSDLRIPAAKCPDGWWISLPIHEGDLRDLKIHGQGGQGAKGHTPGDVEPLGPLDPPKPSQNGSKRVLKGVAGGCVSCGGKAPAGGQCQACIDAGHVAEPLFPKED